MRLKRKMGNRRGEGLSTCSVEGCERNCVGRRLCSMHYQRWRSTGEIGEADPIVRRGANAPRWVNGRYQDRRGYWRIYRPEHHGADVNGYVYEHRFVAEESLGRPLEPGEVVHHVNHDKSDNRAENLEVLTNSEHMRRHAAERAAT